MVKRLFLFFVVNACVVLTLSLILSLIGVQPYLTPYGIDLKMLLIFCLIWGMGGALISLALSRKMAEWMMGVHILKREGEATALYQLVERLARDAGLSVTPKVGIFESSTMNAFATGPTKRQSLVAVSTALLDQMNAEELEAVLAHEISHIANGDMVTMALLQGVVNAFVLFLARAVAYAISSAMRSEGKRLSYFSYYALTFLFEMLFMVLGSLVVAAFSRKREYRADREGALLTRKEQMIAALQKLAGEKLSLSSKKLATSALMISAPPKRGLIALLASHPPLEARIKRLRAGL